jgi:uncharacterized alpha-E superfamily protein
VLSRVADAVYWMSRYIERAENVARIVDVSLQLSLDMPLADAGQWAALVATSGDDGLFRALHGEPERERVLEFLTFDKGYSSSVLSSLRQARENARSVREVISSEMWEQINKAYLMVHDAARTRVVMEAPHAFYAAVKQASHLFVGATDLTMTHNEAWHFARLGRLLERADKTSRMLDVRSYLLHPAADAGGVFDESQWAALLRSASAFEMYRKRHGLIEPLKVVDFLLLDRQFPRSVLYCLGKAGRSLHAITGTALTMPATPAERALGKLHAEFEYAVTKDIVDKGLHEHIDQFQSKLNALGDAIRTTFFSPPIDHARTVAEALAQAQQQQQQ